MFSHRKRRERIDLESALRSHRGTPRPEFLDALSNEVRSLSGRQRSRWERAGTAVALAGLIALAVASFGGVGYGFAKRSHGSHHAVSAARAQYGHFEAPHHAKPPAHHAAAQPQAGVAGAATTKPASLPFSGLALWIPMAAGLLLTGLGLVLRTRGQRRKPAA